MRILLLVFGGIILLVAVVLLIGGGALLVVNTSLTDSEGFLSVENIQLEADSYAIVQKGVDVNVGEELWWKPSPGDIVTIKLTASNNDPSKNVFIGIAEESDANAYLSGVKYDEITRFPWENRRVDYTTHPGGALSEDPTSQTFWTISEHGAGTQTLEWEPESGSYWIVLMNEDGSVGVDLTGKVGVKVPLLSTIALALFAGGVIALIIGGIIIYFGIRR